MDRRSGIIYLWVAVFMLCGAARSSAGDLAAEVRLSQQNASVGEPVTMQIVVSGSESPDQPDLSHLDGFSVSFQGGSRNSSRSISYINGRVTQEVQEGYVFSYQLVPQRAGRLIIPPIPVQAGGRSVVTRQTALLVGKPSQSDDSKLKMTISRTSCYVGEPVTLTVTWYVSGEIDTASYSLPFMEDKDRLYAADPRIDTNVGGPYYRIPAGDGEVIVEKGQGELDGQGYATLTFRKILVPKAAGSLAIDPATVSYKVLTGYRNRRSPFDDEFFSNFFNQGLRQGVYRQGASVSNSLELTVKDLPVEGRPSGFSGLVGEYRMEAEASPVKVNVGDPVTLTVAVSGPDFLDPVVLPPLQAQPDLVRDFKVPSEMAAGELSGNRKIFTQTIRPLRADVNAVPPIQLSYFNPGTGTYETARSAPIPLTVNPTRVVTAQDAEGVEPAGPAGRRIKTRTAGIAGNYDDDQVLTRQIHDPVAWATSSAGLATLALPPVFYLLLVTGTWVRRRKQTDPGAGLARKAGARLIQDMERIRKNASLDQAPADILEAFKVYLRARLRLAPGALTFQDVADLLKEKGVAPETLAEIKSLFTDGEAARYGKSGDSGSGERMAETTRMILKKIDKTL